MQNIYLIHNLYYVDFPTNDIYKIVITFCKIKNDNTFYIFNYNMVRK